MLERVLQIGSGLLADGFENLPASKDAVASLPAVRIQACHVEDVCAVCTDALAVGSEAREMPCKHLFHDGCIFPWLGLHNSCPVCRHELPAVELSVWPLPGGGFAAGRFVEGEVPVVYPEVEEAPSAIDWGPLMMPRPRRSRALRRFFGGGGSGPLRRSPSLRSRVRPIYLFSYSLLFSFLSIGLTYVYNRIFILIFINAPILVFLFQLFPI